MGVQSARVTFARELSVVRLNDGLYHLIGPIEELELAQLGWAGFGSYWEGLKAITRFGYKEFGNIVTI